MAVLELNAMRLDMQNVSFAFGMKTLDTTKVGGTLSSVRFFFPACPPHFTHNCHGFPIVMDFQHVSWMPRSRVQVCELLEGQREERDAYEKVAHGRPTADRSR